MKPGLYRGTIVHQRSEPVAHRFEYAHAMWAIDLADPQAIAHPPLLSVNAPGLASFRERDYLPDRALPLEAEVRARVAAGIGRAPTGRILLLTQPRVFGVHFNPVSFYLCFDRSERLQALLAEVRNTPWNQRHCYALDLSQPAVDAATALRHQRCAKAFHVSPFMDMDFDYAWSVALEGERLALSIGSERPAHGAKGGRVFTASLSLEHMPDTRRANAAALARQPLGPLGVLARIHWQALRLALRGAPFHSNPHGVARKASAARRLEINR